MLCQLIWLNIRITSLAEAGTAIGRSKSTIGVYVHRDYPRIRPVAQERHGWCSRRGMNDRETITFLLLLCLVLLVALTAVLNAPRVEARAHRSGCSRHADTGRCDRAGCGWHVISNGLTGFSPGTGGGLFLWGGDWTLAMIGTPDKLRAGVWLTTF